MRHTLNVVLDTNVLISGIAYPNSVPGKIMAEWHRGSLAVVLSPFILDELRRVLPRLVNRHGLSSAEINDLVDVFSMQADTLEPTAIHAPDLRDMNDFPVLGTLITAMLMHGQSYLVTGDKDLLALADQYPVVTPAAFWAKHGGL